jgi:MGT family glycosyltransferase
MHIAFCIAPFHGHVNPTLAVVAELTRRGHRVSYATTAQFAGLVRAAGARAVPYGPGGPAEPGAPAAAAQPEGAGGPDLVRGLSGQLRELAATLPPLISAFAGDEPDAVVCDPMCWAGRALAARCRVPAINSITTMISGARWSLGPVAASFDPAHPRLPRLLAATSALLAHHETGLTADQLLGTGGNLPVIAYHPRAFEPCGGQLGAGVHFVGPCLRSRPGGLPGGRGAGPTWRRTGDGPVVLVSLGTVFNRQPALFRRCLDALAGLGCQVVAALGGLDPAAVGPLPANARGYDYLPLTEVLPWASVFVGHAGMTSTMEALSFGVPIAALPQITEQHLNARRLADLGLGRCLEPGGQSAGAVRDAVTALLHDAGVRRRADWMRAEIERAPGAPAAAAVIEDAVSEQRMRGGPVAATPATKAVHRG